MLNETTTDNVDKLSTGWIQSEVTESLGNQVGNISLRKELI